MGSRAAACLQLPLSRPLTAKERQLGSGVTHPHRWVARTRPPSCRNRKALIVLNCFPECLSPQQQEETLLPGDKPSRPLGARRWERPSRAGPGHAGTWSLVCQIQQQPRGGFEMNGNSLYLQQPPHPHPKLDHLFYDPISGPGPPRVGGRKGRKGGCWLTPPPAAESSG